jgi:endonuclease/exonuclease/phosphatase family metal-dependent hydrolase
LRIGSVDRVDRRFGLATAVVGLLPILAVALFATPAGAKRHVPKVKFMTRNLDLGADILTAAQSQSFNELKDAVGVLLNDVNKNNFPVRAKGLASEILRKKPDLVALQEVSLWRTEPCTLDIFPPKAKDVLYDYQKLLMRQLNKGEKQYRVVISQPEFDFETQANTDGSPDHSCDINGRLTERDEVILARRGAGVKTRRAKAAHFDELLVEKVSGIDVPVTRGWARVDANVRGSGWFRFVATHLEAFDNQESNHTNQGTDVGNGEVRNAQAKELIANGGPATGNKPVILAGDLNSDVKTPLKPGDSAAFWSLLQAGFAERATRDPLSCCLEGDSLAVGDGANASQFDHMVDHIMTSDPRHVRRVRTSVTGRKPHNGFWNSDHAGLFSTLGFH